MVGKSKPATKAERERFQKLYEHGCQPCKDWTQMFVPTQIHHIVEGYRLGHEYTLPWCPYHHEGHIPENKTREEMERLKGPSYALDKRAFVERFGTERQQLGRVNEAIA